MTNNSFSLPAEWGCKTAVLMALPTPDTDWDPILDKALECWHGMVSAILEFSPVILLTPFAGYANEHMGDLLSKYPGRLVPVTLGYNDTWTRDYGPISLIDSTGSSLLLDFTFNAWGQKFAANLDNTVNRRLKKTGLYTSPLKSCKHMVLEGGGIESDGNGTVMVTAESLLEANRNPHLSKEQIETELKELLGVEKILWLNHGYLEGDDTDSHIDTLARFAPDNTIVYVGCDNPADPHFEELEMMKGELRHFTDINGKPYNLIELPMAPEIIDGDGQRLPSTYANFLVLQDAVIMPSYGDKATDTLAAQILEVAYNRKVTAVDCRALVWQHGSLHCSTMQIPLGACAI